LESGDVFLRIRLARQPVARQKRRAMILGMSTATFTLLPCHVVGVLSLVVLANATRPLQ